MTTTRIGLVGCTKLKLEYAAPACDLYTRSPMFRGRRAFVERTCDRWFILSAKHGVVDPDEVLEPYDQTLVGKPTAVKRTWSELVADQLRAVLGDVRGTTFEVHAGADYWGFGLRDSLTAAGATVEIPTEGLAQGEQLAFYSGGSPPVSKQPTKGRSMGGSYEPLGHYLEGVREDRVTLSFAELEQILGRKLPASAHDHRPWWANHIGSHSHARAWMEAGWEVDQVNPTAQRVTFRRAI